MRPSKDEYFTSIAQLVSTRATCYKKHVGCVLVDSQGYILATGYNGVPSGMSHCIDGDGDCPNRFLDDTARRLRCRAIHAEANALLQCKTRDLIHIAYCTLFPCFSCLKLLAATPCSSIIYTDLRKHPELPLEYLRDFWEKSRQGRTIFCQPISQ
jgi:dCMP deaminase